MRLSTRLETWGREERRGTAAVVARLLAIALLVWFLPMAGYLALGGLVALAILRSRVRIVSLLVVYVLALFFISAQYVASSFAVTAAGAIAVLVLLLWGSERVMPGRQREPLPILSGAVAVWLLVTVFAYGNTMVHAHPGEVVQNADRTLFVALLLAGIAFAAADHLRERADLDRVLLVLVSAAAGMAAIGALQYFASFDVTRWLSAPPGFGSRSGTRFVLGRGGLDRVAGTARHPIEFGIACAAVLPLALHYGRYALRAAIRSWCHVAAMLLALSIALSLSRSAVFALAAAAAVMVPTWSSRRRFAIITAFAAALLALAVVAPDVQTTIGNLLQGEEGTGSLEARSARAELAFDVISEAPWLGHGLAVSHDIGVVDNQYLVAAMEAGILGLVALAGMYAAMAATVHEVRRRTSDEATRDLAQSLLAGAAAIAVGGFGLNVLRFEITAGVLFLLLGAATALARSRAPAGPAGPDPDAADLDVAPVTA